VKNLSQPALVFAQQAYSLHLLGPPDTPAVRSSRSRSQAPSQRVEARPHRSPNHLAQVRMRMLSPSTSRRVRCTQSNTSSKRAACIPAANDGLWPEAQVLDENVGEAAISSRVVLSRTWSTEDTRSAIPSFEAASSSAESRSETASFAQSPRQVRMRMLRIYTASPRCGLT
jgi:hypothetical protein